MEEIAISSTSLWNRDTLADANSYLRALTEFRFIIALVITKNVLAHTKGLSVKLQGKWQDIARAYKDFKLVKESLSKARGSMDSFHRNWYEESCLLGSKVNVQPSVPRTNNRQTQRTNTPATSESEYYKRTISIPLLDHILSELDSPFHVSSERVTIFMSLMPSAMLSKQYINTGELNEIISLYGENLPCQSTIATELHCWKIKWERDRKSCEMCNTLVKALAAADKDIFPNIHTLLQIAVTQPVTSCECERSISKLRLLKSVRRSTMTEERLNGLALISVHRDIYLDLDCLLNEFARMHPRRLKLLYDV